MADSDTFDEAAYNEYSRQMAEYTLLQYQAALRSLDRYRDAVARRSCHTLAVQPVSLPASPKHHRLSVSSRLSYTFLTPLSMAEDRADRVLSQLLSKVSRVSSIAAAGFLTPLLAIIYSQIALVRMPNALYDHYAVYTWVGQDVYWRCLVGASRARGLQAVIGGAGWLAGVVGKELA
ncbi:hypothetical protein FISHEDRAFT_77767 [Fistulina hepatica ATCC 64428]|nr:hypothetical protein FISHEDRAFT_77767 [Fistulina hepatica ATCC 64428]